MPQKTDRLVTVFGGSGFIGRYLAQALFARGQRVRIAGREPRRAFFLKPLASVGQVQFAAADITDPTQAARAVQGSDAVINLVGILKGRFEAVHHHGAANVARAAAAAGVPVLVHVSAIGADPEAPSRYARTKGEGEQAVRSAFPAATIVRPSIAFGMEDHFVNRFASMARLLPVVPVIRGQWRLQPAHAADVARAIALAALDPRSHGGKTYELGGPQVLTMRELVGWIGERTGRGSKPILDIPDPIARLMAKLGGWLPGAPITWDQWLMLQKDNVVSESAAGFEAFGIAPSPLAAVAEGWLTAYRRSGRFAAKSPY
ncbi:complex I NDUFA9 subunit family protein [Allosphingosinicella sp.]|jgi:NADH dehydrogenase|uniref:complex I NDUFA9 subunit family protein n=1 Tax=Allosphingosinicella sp. TaxID=2823234 RepID=UPI002F23B8FE